MKIKLERNAIFRTEFQIHLLEEQFRLMPVGEIYKISNLTIDIICSAQTLLLSSVPYEYLIRSLLKNPINKA